MIFYEGYIYKVSHGTKALQNQGFKFTLSFFIFEFFIFLKVKF